MHSTVPSSFSVSRKGIISLLVLALFFMSVGFVNTGSVTAQDECVIPDSGPWPSCATGEEAAPAPAPDSTPDECVIPASGPWPPCATGNDTAPDPAPAPAPENGGECVIPDSGPWPDCAKGGGGGSSPAPAPSPSPEECVIPESGPWPPCATDDGGGTAPAPEAEGECIIPASGPWPPCATDGGGGGTAPPPPDEAGATTPPPADDLPPRAPGANEVAPRPSAPGAPSTSSTVIQVTNDVAVSGAKRLGLNVGARNQFGAAQLIKNIVPNPGFEAGQFTMVIHTLPDATGNRVQADNWETNWNNDVMNIGHLPGFWNGAQFEVVTGNAKGRTGTVDSFTHEGGRYTFNLNGGGVAPGQDDIVVFRQYNVPGYELDAQQFAKAAPETKRPGSPGQQALRLVPASNTASWKTGFDSYARDEDNGAGKLMVVEGPWHFEIWAKSEFGGGTLDVSFRRLGEAEFIRESFPLTSEWQKFAVDFNVAQGLDAQIVGVPQPLTLEFTVSGNTFIDDVILQQADHSNPTVFSDSYVQSLREMRPGILRNWGAQPGSSLNNLLSNEFARRTTGSSPKDRLPRKFTYSLPEFLALCEHVGANPWIVLPATLSDAELNQFMAYMGNNWVNKFGKIHVEYGNEVWGANFGADPFLGQSFRGGERAGIVSNDRIATMKASPFYSGKFDFVIGGQSRFPGRQTEIEANSDAHDSIGFAPYYGELQDASSDRTRYLPLYAHAEEIDERGHMFENKKILDDNGTNMSIYEINLHTIRNFVEQGVRNDTLTSQGAAISLPLVMLSYMRDMGVTDQAVFQSAQFSEPAPGGHAALFGVLRDIEATGRKRPTGLALEMANKVIGGEMLAVNTSGSPSFSVPGGNGMAAATTQQTIEAFAFKQGGRYGLVLFNMDLTNAHQATVQLPSAPGGAQMWMLGADDIHMDNEVNNEVGIFNMPINLGQQTNINLAPHTMYVISWNG